MQGATDQAVMDRAEAEQRVVVSADTDFGTLLARSGAKLPTVLLIRRLVGRRAAEQEAIILANLPAVTEDLESGAVVILQRLGAHPPASHAGLSGLHDLPKCLIPPGAGLTSELAWVSLRSCRNNLLRKIKAAPLCGAGSGAPRAGLCVGTPARHARAVPAIAVPPI
jgi:predicted nuclease of predicted toxin-antitoxin system